MSKNKIEIIDSNFIETINIKVTQKILPKYLLDFCRTTVLNSNLELDSEINYHLFSTFIESTLTYEILIIKNTFNQKHIIEPFIFKAFYNDKNIENNVDIFITKNYFVIFKNHNFLLLKNISNISQNDIKIFAEQNYKLSIDNIYTIDSSQLQDIKNTYIKDYFKNDKIYKNIFFLYQTNSFRYFMLFGFIGFIILGYSIYATVSPSGNIKSVSFEQKRYIQLINKYNNHKTNIINDTIDLFGYLKLNKITLLKLNYTTSKLNIKISNSDKNKLLDFTTIYNKNIDIKSLNFIEDQKLYIMRLEIEY